MASQRSRTRAEPGRLPAPIRRQTRQAKAERNGQAAAQAVDLAELTDRTGYIVRRAQVWIFQDVIRAMAGFDIRPAQFSVLTVIGANPGLSQSAVSQALGIERARLAVMLHGLEGRGLAKRMPSRSDKRSHALHLTLQGERLLAQLKSIVAAHEQRVIAKIGAEGKRQLLRILSVFLAD
jgi:DNA-binding MarR family transcriptional regulator